MQRQVKIDIKHGEREVLKGSRPRLQRPCVVLALSRRPLPVAVFLQDGDVARGQVEGILQPRTCLRVCMCRP